MVSEAIILGGGASIKEGLSLNLQNKIKNKLVIGCNFAFNHFEVTLTCFGDYDFYIGKLLNDDIINPEHVQKLKNLPLIVGILPNGEKYEQYSNTIFLKRGDSFNLDIKKGWYRASLTGILAISLAGYLLDWNGKIFLCGFDWTKKGESHYYSKDEINHRGQDNISYYQSHNPNAYFGCFTTIPTIKIYNVNLNSSISNFQKITYSQMFHLLNQNIYHQDNLRQFIKEKLQ